MGLQQGAYFTQNTGSVSPYGGVSVPSQEQSELLLVNGPLLLDRSHGVFDAHPSEPSVLEDVGPQHHQGNLQLQIQPQLVDLLMIDAQLDGAAGQTLDFLLEAVDKI